MKESRITGAGHEIKTCPKRIYTYNSLATFRVLLCALRIRVCVISRAPVCGEGLSHLDLILIAAVGKMMYVRSDAGDLLMGDRCRCGISRRGKGENEGPRAMWKFVIRIAALFFFCSPSLRLSARSEDFFFFFQPDSILPRCWARKVYLLSLKRAGRDFMSYVSCYIL